MWQQTAAIYAIIYMYVYNMILYLLHNHAHSIYRGHTRNEQRMVTCAVNNAQLMRNLLELLFVHCIYIGRLHIIAWTLKA